MTTSKLAAITAAATVALSGLAPAAGLAKASHPGRAHVAVKSTYVYERAGVLFTGTMFKGNTFKVERLSPSGRWAYGMAYGHVNRHAWISAAVLTQK
ncbi:MAG: hypothetical protein ABI950_07205 [Solirubrobacteraceae bacterium]